MTSVSFDPMAHAYDAIRGYPQEVSRQNEKFIEKERLILSRTQKPS